MAKKQNVEGEEVRRINTETQQNKERIAHLSQEIAEAKQYCEETKISSDVQFQQLRGMVMQLMRKSGSGGVPIEPASSNLVSRMRDVGKHPVGNEGKNDYLDREDRRGEGGHRGRNNELMPKSRVELTYFAGVGPRSWLKKCEGFFRDCVIADWQKVDIAALYLTGEAKDWYYAYQITEHHPPWHIFASDLLSRFENESLLGVAGEFHTLRQEGPAHDYQLKFDALRGLLLRSYPNLDDEFFKDCFLSGLNDELKSAVMVTRPRNLIEAYENSIHQEEGMKAQKRGK